MNALFIKKVIALVDMPLPAVDPAYLQAFIPENQGFAYKGMASHDSDITLPLNKPGQWITLKRRRNAG